MREEEINQFREEIIEDLKKDIENGKIPSNEVDEILEYIDEIQKMSTSEFWKEAEDIIDAFHKATGEPV